MSTKMGFEEKTWNSDDLEFQNSFPPHFIPGKPLPPAVIGEPKDLSEEGLRKIKALSGNAPLDFYKELISAWLVIFAMILGAVYLKNWLFSILAIFIIATRQNVLGLLTHDQAHKLAGKGKIADALVNLFCAWPLIFLSVESYSKIHLAHHRFYFSKDDPDFFRKNGPDWTFPMKWSRLGKLFLMDFLGFNLLKTIKGKNGRHSDLIKRPPSLPTGVRVLYFLILAGLFTYFHLWEVFLIYWMIPLLTFFQVIIRLGAICEHKYNVATQRSQDSTAIIQLSWWERLLLPNLNFHYHVYHHYFPHISFCHLPQVHQIFLEEGLVNREAVFRGYWGYLKYLMTHP